MIKNLISIKINKNFSYSFCFLKNNKLLLFSINNTIYYFLIQKPIFISKTEKDIINVIFNNSNKISIFLTSFYNSLQLISKNLLLLKGLGLKVTYVKEFHTIDLKLGFSHLIKLKINPDIGIFIKKNLLYFESMHKESLGNLLNKIRNFKYPDSYRGKGIWYKNEKLKMKQVKKK